MAKGIQRQTKLATIGYALMFTSILAITISSKMSGVPINVTTNLVLMTLTIPLTLYIINCTVVGGCVLYAWIHAYIALTLGIVMSIGAIFTVVSLKK